MMEDEQSKFTAKVWWHAIFVDESMFTLYVCGGSVHVEGPTSKIIPR